MGGFGSGRWRDDTKELVSDRRILDVRIWQREGMLEPGDAGSMKWLRRGERQALLEYHTEKDRVQLIYTMTNKRGIWRRIEQQIPLEWTHCHYGGKRAWFQCPDCFKRVALLYGADGFSCRHCQELVYGSQRESAVDRSFRKVAVLRNRLGWSPGVMNGHQVKPKWMRWGTFEKLCNQHNNIAEISLASLKNNKEKLRILHITHDDFRS